MPRRRSKHVAFGTIAATVASSAAFAAGTAGSFLGCSSGTLHSVPDAGAKIDAAADAGPACKACVTDTDCSGLSCAQVAGDSYCLLPCPNGDECGTGTVCYPVSSVAGETESVCLAQTNICGSGQTPPDAGLLVPAYCQAIVPPTGDAGCGGCDGGHCQPNGCRHDLYCDTSTNTCEMPPSACSGGVAFDGGAAVDGSVGAEGGTVSRLYFAIVGDTRPANVDDTAGYPTQIIDTIFSDITALQPMPSFVVSTGDYQFASITGTEQGPQLDLYVAARSKYPGVQFPAMGNHECNGATVSNCGTGSFSGITPNMSAFLTKLLAPIGQTSPYYVETVNAADGSWSSKFVFIAANAWSNAQSAWLDQALSVPTTYTFVVRHESAEANTAPGVTPSEAIIAAHPYTLEILGHTHTYEHLSPQAIIVGNGGAPLSGPGNYGYGVIGQQSDLTLNVDEIDYQSGLADSNFHFAVHPDGSPAP